MGNRLSDSAVQSGNLSDSGADTEYPSVERCTEEVGFAKRAQREENLGGPLLSKMAADGVEEVDFLLFKQNLLKGQIGEIEILDPNTKFNRNLYGRKA